MHKLAVIFDMDGVIVNNHTYHFRAWQKLSEKYGFTLDEGYYMEFINGRTMQETVPIILGKAVDNETIKRIGNEKEALYRKIYKPDIKPVKGLTGFLEELKKKNIPRSIATSAPAANVEFTMNETGLREYFLTIIDDGQVEKGKPDPEIYLKSAEALAKLPKDCIVFEDALSGIKAGKNAGMKVVALATSHKREDLEKAADFVIDDFTKITIDQLKSELKL